MRSYYDEKKEVKKMGFFDVLSSIATSLLDSAQKQQSQTLKKAGRDINSYERNISQAESNSSSMSREQQAKIKEAREKLENNKTILDNKNYENDYMKDEVERRKQAEKNKG